MQRFVIFLLVSAVAGISSTPGFAQRRHSHFRDSFSVSTHDRDSDNCRDQVDIYSDDLPGVAYAEESHNLPNQPVKITAARNGGIVVRNSSNPEITIKVCKAAAARSDADAKRIVEQISLATSNNGVVTVNGPATPDGEMHWTATLIVNVPAGATLDLNADNGGIALIRVNANVTANTQNGGISLRETSGKATVQAENGGISIKDCGGEVKASVQNGGISIALSDTWNGSGLVAKSHNGGVVVEIPKNFSSSLEIASLGYGSMSCNSEACGQGQRTWDDSGKLFRIGSSEPVIRASTVNGGIVIKDRGRGHDEN